MMLTCRETTRLASDRFERRLSLRERFALLTHTLVCPFCRRFTRQVRWMEKFFNTLSSLDDGHLAEIGQRSPADRERMVRSAREQ